MAHWPDDDDGAVLQGLADDGFDFDQTYDVDYMIDFQHWPPARDVLAIVEPFGRVEAIEPSEEGDGYLLVVVRQKVTYENVTSTQRLLTAATASFGGNCEAWGVMDERGAAGQ